MKLARPTPRQLAEAYADAVVASATADGVIAIDWREGALHLDRLDPGQSAEDLPVFVTAGMTVYYPWCRDTGVTCVGWPEDATRDDVAKVVLESGYADKLVDLVCSNAP